MKLVFGFFCVAVQLFAAYSDDELEGLWASIKDIHSPTLEEYRLIDQYLAKGKRPYFRHLYEATRFDPSRMERILSFRLIGDSDVVPVCETYDFNVNEKTDKRCIVLYGSANGAYRKKALRLLGEIENSGYSGHVLLRIGGFPNTQFGGLKICHVPYACKVAFLEEARLLGYQEILWLDLAIHPLDGFEEVFLRIKENGHFFTNVGSLQDNYPTHLLKAAEALQITENLYPQIPHLSSSMIGINVENRQAVQLLKIWYAETANVYPSMTWWPEELSLSVAAWRMGCKPFTWFGNMVCSQSEMYQLENRPSVQFYLDSSR